MHFQCCIVQCLEFMAFRMQSPPLKRQSLRQLPKKTCCAGYWPDRVTLLALELGGASALHWALGHGSAPESFIAFLRRICCYWQVLLLGANCCVSWLAQPSAGMGELSIFAESIIRTVDRMFIWGSAISSFGLEEGFYVPIGKCLYCV